MILTGDFFTIEDEAKEAGRVSADLLFDAGHDIFKGHFPGQPVVPGVCMLQIVKEWVESAIGQSLRLNKASDIKFLTVIDPSRTPKVKAELLYSNAEDGQIKASARFFLDNTLFFKFQGIFSPAGARQA